MKAVRGHALQDEGAAFRYVGLGDRRGDVRQHGDLEVVRAMANSVAGHGFAMCECGMRSPVFDTAAERRRWHRTHKAEEAPWAI